MGTSNINNTFTAPRSLQENAEPHQPQTQSVSAEQTDAAALQSKWLPGNFTTAEGRQQAQKLWVQITGLAFDEQEVETLTRHLPAGLLQRARQGFTQQVLENTPRTELAQTWGAFVGEAAKAYGSGLDVNSLVQYVLRDAYMENTLDLHFYAEKVRFFNECKKAIREQLNDAREELANYAGQDGDALLDSPFLYTEVDTTYTGANEPSARAPSAEAQQAGATYAEAQAAFIAAAEQARTGGGVRLWDGTPELDPPANGDVFITENGDRIDVNGHDVRIYTPTDDGSYVRHTRIWGDPHVDEGAGGDDWHFGDDSTFILEDGTKICLNTEETSSGIFVVKGVDILSGEDHAFVGLSPEDKEGNEDREAGVTSDRFVFDADNDDTLGTSGGVFAMQSNGQWAMLGTDGQFRDVRTESWAGYLSSKDVTTRGGPVNVTEAQQRAANDALSQVAVDTRGVRDAAREEVGEHAAITKEELETFIQNTEEKLNSVGDDAQLANVDLQNMLQKQQQTLQMMSNISKMLHDTAMAVIRKIGS